MDDLKPFKHADEGAGSTNWVCDARLNKEGGKARCCECVPHENCSEEGESMREMTEGEAEIAADLDIYFDKSDFWDKVKRYVGATLFAGLFIILFFAALDKQQNYKIEKTLDSFENFD